MTKAKWRPMDAGAAYPAPAAMTKAWLEGHFGWDTAPGYSKIIFSRTEECTLFKRSRMAYMMATGWMHEVLLEMPAGRAIGTGYHEHDDQSVPMWRYWTAYDAALVDDRFIVDASQPGCTGSPDERDDQDDARTWTAKTPISTQVVFDLRDPADVAELERIHGSMAKWTDLPAWFRAEHGIPVPPRPDWMKKAA